VPLANFQAGDQPLGELSHIRRLTHKAARATMIRARTAELCYLTQLPSSVGGAAPVLQAGAACTGGVEMGSELVQLSALVGCAAVALRCIIQLTVVLWSLKADADGRQHALALLLALRGERPKRQPPEKAP
jgi:hypothetical protein